MKSVAMRGVLALVLMGMLAGSTAVASIDSPRVPGTDAPPVDSLVASALSRSPSLAELRARVQGARERVRGAGALPNPMVELMLQDVGFPAYTVGEEDMSMIGPQLTQAIPFPGKRGARKRAAQADVSVRERELAAMQREIVRDVRVLAARLYAIDAEDEVLTQGWEVLSALTASARDRYSAGGIESGPMLEARLAQYALEERRDDLLAERKGVTTALGRLMDDGIGDRLGRMRALPATEDGNGAFVPDTPELAVRAAQTQAAEAQLRSARAERLPDLVAGAGVGLRGTRERVVTLRLGLDLPLWGGVEKRAMARAAEQDVVAARAAERVALASGSSQMAQLLADGNRSRQQVARYRDQIIPDSRLAYESARSNYGVGRGDMSDVLKNFNAWLEARTGLARREAEVFANWAEIARIRRTDGEGTHTEGQR